MKSATVRLIEQELGYCRPQCTWTLYLGEETKASCCSNGVISAHSE